MILFGLFGLFGLGGLMPVSSAQPFPDAQELMGAARVLQMNREATLRGQIRTESGRSPFLLKVEPGIIGYHFADPPEALLVDYGKKGADVIFRSGGKTSKVSGKDLDQPLRDIGMSYRDLGLEFLYWKDAEVVHEERIKGRDAWLVDMRPAPGESKYGVVRVWVDKKTGALMRMQGYDPQARLVRKFEVTSVGKIDGVWMLKQMRVEEFDPENGKVTNRTYIEIDPGRSEIEE